eukprot:5978862-Alexandrium_andersonii.AAC.1
MARAGLIRSAWSDRVDILDTYPGHERVHKAGAQLRGHAGVGNGARPKRSARARTCFRPNPHAYRDT